MSEPRFDLFGQSPAEMIAPKTIAESQAWVRDNPKKAISVWGGGTRRRVGYAPERYDTALSTKRLNAITDYQPADLTVTAQAGVTVAALQETLAERGQWLPLDIAQPETQTIGGIIATRADTLRRFGCGSVRDSLIGVSVINSRGELIKGGGKVVKNVSGYDLPKLYCGSFGTLGLIAEASFKVAPLPEASATVIIPLDAEHNSEEMLDGLLASPLLPSFLYLLNPAAAREIVSEEAADAQYIVLGVDGTAESVAWQIETLGVPPTAETDADGLRARLRDYALTDAPMTVSFHILSSQVGAFARMVEWTARRAGFAARVWADAAVGIVWAHFAPARPESDWRVFYPDLKDKADRCGGSFIIERMPDALRAASIPVWSPPMPDWALMARLKETLDPARMWNPGRFVGRI